MRAAFQHRLRMKEGRKGERRKEKGERRKKKDACPVPAPPEDERREKRRKEKEERRRGERRKEKEARRKGERREGERTSTVATSCSTRFKRSATRPPRCAGGCEAGGATAARCDVSAALMLAATEAACDRWPSAASGAEAVRIAGFAAIARAYACRSHLATCGDMVRAAVGAMGVTLRLPLVSGRRRGG